MTLLASFLMAEMRDACGLPEVVRQVATGRELWNFPYSRRTTNVLRLVFGVLYGRGSRQ